MESNRRSKILYMFVGLVLGALIASGAYVLGSRHLTQSQTSQSTSATTAGTANNETALVVDAAHFYLAAKGTGFGTNQVYDVQVTGNNARGKFFNNDSGSVFYAHKSANRWQIVFGGQNLPPESLVKQNNMPANWATQVF